MRENLCNCTFLICVKAFNFFSMFQLFTEAIIIYSCTVPSEVNIWVVFCTLGISKKPKWKYQINKAPPLLGAHSDPGPPQSSKQKQVCRLCRLFTWEEDLDLTKLLVLKSKQVKSFKTANHRAALPRVSPARLRLEMSSVNTQRWMGCERWVISTRPGSACLRLLNIRSPEGNYLPAHTLSVTWAVITGCRPVPLRTHSTALSHTLSVWLHGCTMIHLLQAPPLTRWSSEFVHFLI